MLRPIVLRVPKFEYASTMAAPEPGLPSASASMSTPAPLAMTFVPSTWPKLPDVPSTSSAREPAPLAIAVTLRRCVKSKLVAASMPTARPPAPVDQQMLSCSRAPRTWHANCALEPRTTACSTTPASTSSASPPPK